MGTGVGLIVAGGLLALGLGVGGWRRMPAPAALVAMAVCGALVGSGALLVQDPGRVGAADWVLTLLALGALTPLHARLVLGRPGEGP